MSEDHEVREALHRIAPRLETPDDLLPKARSRRARRRAGALTGAALAVVALAMAVAPQLQPFDGGASDTAADARSDVLPEAAELGDGGADEAAGGQESPETIVLPYASTAGVGVAAASSERLAWTAIGNTDAANRLVSPSSLALSLAMTAEGARGGSLASIDRALGLAGDERAGAFGALRQSLAGYAADPAGIDLDEPPATPAVHLTNRVVTIDATAEPAFLGRLGAYFDAPLVETTLPAAQEELDSWVRENTAGLIESSGIEVDGDTRVVVQDALLFAAAWRTWFTEELELPFHGPSGTRDVEMVRGVVEARSPAADVILPREGLAPEDLTADELAEARRALDEAPLEEIQVTMPAIDLSARTDLSDALPEIDLSDLGGIVPGGQVGQWVQQARLRINARGTIGAATTELAVLDSARLGPEPRAFAVDRPYAVRVLNTRTGWPLFLATVAEPVS